MADVNDPLWTTHTQSDLIDRVRELEGLLAATTRQLESVQRELADATDALSTPMLELAEVETPAHLAEIDAAIARLAGWLGDDGETGVDDLLVIVKDSGSTAVELIANAIASLAAARDRLSPKPLPPIR